MEAGDTRAADLVDTVHRKMDSAVHNHRFYKSVQSRVIGKQVLLEKKPLANPHDEFAQYVVVVNDSQIVGCTPSKLYSQITWYYIT